MASRRSWIETWGSSAAVLPGAPLGGPRGCTHTIFSRPGSVAQTEERLHTTLSKLPITGCRTPLYDPDLWALKVADARRWKRNHTDHAVTHTVVANDSQTLARFATQIPQFDWGIFLITSLCIYRDFDPLRQLNASTRANRALIAPHSRDDDEACGTLPHHHHHSPQPNTAFVPAGGVISAPIYAYTNDLRNKRPLGLTDFFLSSHCSKTGTSSLILREKTRPCVGVWKTGWECNEIIHAGLIHTPKPGC
jgi:hypothetical protein